MKGDLYRSNLDDSAYPARSETTRIRLGPLSFSSTLAEFEEHRDHHDNNKNSDELTVPRILLPHLQHRLA